jgi:hypothetical protein
VIIGGHLKKTEKVLLYLNRMYMPMQNYRDMEPEMLDAYRAIGKDVIGVRSFSALVPEVCCFSDRHLLQLRAFFKERLSLERAPHDLDTLPADRRELAKTAALLRQQAEETIRRRLAAIERHVRNQGDNLSSLEEIFRLPRAVS